MLKIFCAPLPSYSTVPEPSVKLEPSLVTEPDISIKPAPERVTVAPVASKSASASYFPVEVIDKVPSMSEAPSALNVPDEIVSSAPLETVMASSAVIVLVPTLAIPSDTVNWLTVQLAKVTVPLASDLFTTMLTSASFIAGHDSLALLAPSKVMVSLSVVKVPELVKSPAISKLEAAEISKSAFELIVKLPLISKSSATSTSELPVFDMVKLKKYELALNVKSWSDDPSKVTVPPEGSNASSAAPVQSPATVISPPVILTLLVLAEM